ncbi:MAG: hypothetical protein V4507_07080 [Verrucomicrobiota bacterium]
MNTPFYKHMVAGFLKSEDQEYELYACANGNFDDAQSLLTIHLKCYIRLVSIPDAHLYPEWLPPSEIVSTTCFEKGAKPYFQEMLRLWFKKVHTSIPQAEEWGLEKFSEIKTPVCAL